MTYTVEFVTVAGRRIVRVEYEQFLKDLKAAVNAADKPAKLPRKRRYPLCAAGERHFACQF